MHNIVIVGQMNTNPDDVLHIFNECPQKIYKEPGRPPPRDNNFYERLDLKSEYLNLVPTRR